MIKKMLDENNCNDLTIQSYAAIKSLERIYSDLMKYVNEELYYTSFFEGKLHLYGNILIDSEGLDHSCEMYGIICNILTKIQKGRDEYKDFFEKITNVLENRKEFCSNCVAYDKLKLLVYGIDSKTSNEKSFTEYYKILMNEIVEEKCIKYISLRRTQKIANMEIFQLSKKMIEFNFIYQYPMMESSIFLLRQSIEVQVKNSLNIGELRNINKNGKMTSEVGISKILDFIDEKIKDKKIVIAVDITTLKKINSWLNKYIHTGKMSYGMWYIEWIHHYLLDFFHLSDLYRKHMKYSNLEASIIIEENLYKNLDKEIENFFKNKVKLVHQRHNIAYVVDQKTIDSILVDKNKSKYEV